MKDIIAPIDREILKGELTQEKFLRPTNKSGNHIYIVTAHDSPNVMREIGRLREMSFRSGGGGTGEELDTDKYDYMENPYKQLIVWDPDAKEIIGGYRFLSGADVKLDENGQPAFVMSHLFSFSDKFIKEYMPHTIELGRAFVQPDYQTTKMGMKSLFALDNLWDGLGALIHSVKGAKYFIGKVTIYKNYPVKCRELIYEYLSKHFQDTDKLIQPKKPIVVSAKTKKLAKTVFKEENPVDDYKLLNKVIRNEGDNIPPMFNAYIGLTDTMRFFGSIQDHDFGSVYETGLMVIMDDLLETKKQRYIQPYVEYLRKLMDERKAARKLAREEKLKLKMKKIKEKEAKKTKKAKKEKDKTKK
ncbi:MAG: GNAT family N-acetyltransferase [Paludibacter sp.]|nr:GNAT family N-acetyltransferase [Paludibacter sp.]MDD4197902.1 GNAT family N-acetyltransferase [Paludibacter sp.]MDD4427545.1 GNAT family N-acetyltransferase [Paludibacter sp.]